jgi:C-terminal peptidase prc
VLYVERERATPQVLWEHGIEELARALANPVFRQAFLDNPAAEKLDSFRTGLKFLAKKTVTDAQAARFALRKLVTDAQKAFAVRVPSALVIEVVCGACSGLDEYTVFLNPAQANPDSLSAAPDLSAQGVYLAVADGKLVVAGVASGSWAAFHTRLRKGDVITAINSHPMTEGVTPALVADALRAPMDGAHVLDLAPPDPEAAPPVVSLPVAVPTVYGIAIKPAKDGTLVGYIRIGSIGPTTPRELDDAIHFLKANQGARTFVIDLRGNMGGSFLAAVDTAKRLLPAGLIVTTQGQAAEVDNVAYPSDSGMTAHDVPVVILVDAETASAAEVLAAALKDNNRAQLVGMPTFGKGAIQYPLRLDWLDEKDPVTGKPKTNKTGTVRLTIAKLIAPRGGTINGVGISPHFLEADPTAQLEVALQKAVEALPMMSPPRPTMPMMP